MNCRIGQEERCKLNGCEFEKTFFCNCKDYIPVYVPPVLEKVKKLKKIKRKPCKKIKPIPEHELKKTESVYSRSNGVCYICGEPIIKSEFRLYNSISFGFSAKANKYNGLKNQILRASHKECKQKAPK